MAPHTKKMTGHGPAKANLKNIFICGDIWLSIFPCLGTAEVALKVALISDRYDALVDTHFKTLKLTLGDLTLQRSKDGTGAEIVKRKQNGWEWLPFPQVPPSKNFVGFNKITIRYIDHNVIDFLRRIQHLFNTGITLNLGIYGNQKRSWKVIAKHVWPLFGSNINKMLLTNSRLAELRAHISSNVLRDCANLRSIAPHDPFSYPVNDHHLTSDDQALFKWLHTPRDDGRPKVLKYSFGYKITTVIETQKQAFREASASVNYIIVLKLGFEHQPFELENEQTRERLESQRVHPTSYFWLLKRGPIARDATKWAEWEREAMEFWRNQKNVIDLSIGYNDIGRLSQAGPSSSK